MNDKSAKPPHKRTAAAPAKTPPPPTAPVKTPLFQATHASRYLRQELIRKIEARTGRSLICYVAGIDAPIDRDDTLGFVELLYNIPKGTDIDLLLQTPGGDIDAAEKIVGLLNPAAAHLKVIVPDMAKSAGTLLALGASAIVMSDSSELGTIDPQVLLNDGRGNLIPHSVLHYLEAYKTQTRTLQASPRDVPATIMMNKLDPTTVKLFEAIKARAEKLAGDQLKRRMFNKVPGPWTAIVKELMDIEKWPSHGQVIGYEDAIQMGLSVEYLEPTDELWRMYWQLYTLQRLAITDAGKLFESNYASHQVEDQP